MKNKHSEEINNLINSQVQDIKKHISDVESYMKEEKTAQAFSSLRLIAHTDAMKIFGARVLNNVAEEIIGNNYYDITADSSHIIYKTEDFTIKFPIIDKRKSIIIVDEKIKALKREKDKFDDENNHLTNLELMNKLEEYHKDKTDENLREFVKLRSGDPKISFIKFARNKESYKEVYGEETLKMYRDMVELGEEAYKNYTEAHNTQVELLIRAEKSLVGFLEIGYEIKLFT